MTGGEKQSSDRPRPNPSADEIRNWIVTHVAQRLNVLPAEIQLDEPLIDVGLDSMEFVALVGEIETWLGCRFRDNPLIDFPTANLLSEFLARQIAQGKTVIDPTERETL